MLLPTVTSLLLSGFSLPSVVSVYSHRVGALLGVLSPSFGGRVLLAVDSHVQDPRRAPPAGPLPRSGDLGCLQPPIPQVRLRTNLVVTHKVCSAVWCRPGL